MLKIKTKRKMILSSQNVCDLFESGVWRPPSIVSLGRLRRGLDFWLPSNFCYFWLKKEVFLLRS